MKSVLRFLNEGLVAIDEAHTEAHMKHYMGDPNITEQDVEQLDAALRQLQAIQQSLTDRLAAKV